MAKRKRGRPTIAETFFGDGARAVETTWENANLKSKRSIADYIYCTAATSLLKEAASEIPYIEKIFRMERGDLWFSRSIMAQLGRMLLQDDYDEDSVIEVAKFAARAIHENCKVKQVELNI